MATQKINTVVCGEGIDNTGYSECPVHMNIEGFIQVPSSKDFTDKEIEDLTVTLNAMAANNTKSLRAFPFPKLVGADVTGGDPVKVDFDNGASTTTFEKQYMLKGMYYTGGVPLHSSLRTRNGQNVSFLFYGAGKVWGAVINGKKRGFPVTNFGADAQKPGAFQKRSEYDFHFNVETKYLNTNGKYWYIVNDDVADIAGLKNITLVAPVAPQVTAGLVVLGVVEQGYGTNYAELYPSITTLAFTAKNGTTGNAITIQSKTVIDGKLAIQLDVADPDYPAALGTVVIAGPNVAALIAANIPNAEIINSVTVTV